MSVGLNGMVLRSGRTVVSEEPRKEPKRRKAPYVVVRRLNIKDLVNIRQEVCEVDNGTWSWLPDIILDIVFTHLPLKDRVSASRVCRHWSRAFHNPNLWRTIYIDQHMDDVTPDSLNRILEITKRYGHRLRELRIAFSSHYSLELDRAMIAVIDNIHGRAHQLTHFFIENPDTGSADVSAKMLSSVTQFLRTQSTLSEVDMRDLFLPIYQGNSLLRAIAEGSGNNLRQLMLQGFFNSGRAVFRNRNYLSIFQKFQHLENVYLDYNCVSEAVIACLSQNCKRHLKLLTISCSQGDDIPNHTIRNHVWTQFRMDCPDVLVEFDIVRYFQDLWRLKQLLPPEVPLALFHFWTVDWDERVNSMDPIDFIAYVMTHFENTLEEIDVYFDETIPMVDTIFQQSLPKLKKLAHLRIKAVFPDTFVDQVKAMQDEKIINLRSFEALSTTGFQAKFGVSRYTIELH